MCPLAVVVGLFVSFLVAVQVGDTLTAAIGIDSSCNMQLEVYMSVIVLSFSR